MKKHVFYLLFFIGTISSIFGQEINKNNLFGDWYLINKKSRTSIETLTFSREMLDSTFTKWSFKNNETLIVGCGYLINFSSKSEQKGTVLSSLDNFNWSLKKDDNQLADLKISNSGKIDTYSVLFLDKKTLELKMVNTMLLTSQNSSNKKHIYYLTFAQADTTVFDKATLNLSSTRLNMEFSRLELNADSTFCYYYNIEYKTKITSDPIKNEATAVVVEKSDKVIGEWHSRDINKNLQLTFNNKRTIDYSISSDKERFYLTRK
jgi:hypothetical protein